MFMCVPRAYVCHMSLVLGSVWLTSIAAVSGTTVAPCGNVAIRKVSLAGVTGRPFHWPGTGIAWASEAAATISTAPCTYSGRSSGPVSRDRNVMALTVGVVVSEYGPMWPGASGLT